MSPHHLSKHPHELLNADFFKELASFYLEAGCAFYADFRSSQRLFSKPSKDQIFRPLNHRIIFSHRSERRILLEFSTLSTANFKIIF